MKNHFLPSLFTLTLFFSIQIVHSQNLNKKDSVRIENNSKKQIPIPIEMRNLELSPDKYIESNEAIANSIHRSDSAIISPLFNINNKIWPELNNQDIRITPYNYSSYNPFEGITLQGMQSHFIVSDRLTANLNLFLSSTYFGTIQPDPYINGSLKLDIIFKLHDRVQLVGMGQFSIREGIDPRVPSSIGNANYYGAGIQFKVTRKLGIGVGVTNSYYKGKWTRQSYAVPVGY